MRAPLIGLLLLAGSGLAVTAQQPLGGFRILRSEQISTADPMTPHYETYLATDPRDPAHMIAISSVERLSGKTGSNIYATTDGGTHWQRAVLHDSSLIQGGDALVYIDHGGIAYTVMGTRVAEAPKTVISRSEDGGRSWGAPTVLPYRDRPWMAFDTSNAEGSIFAGVMYVVGQLDGMIVSRSTDNGQTWSYGDLINRDEGGPDPGARVGGIPGSMLVGPKGVVVIPYWRWPTAYLPEPGGTDSVAESRVDLLVSEDAGRSWLGVRHGPEKRDISGHRGDEAMGAPSAAIDATRGPYRGRIYVAAADFSTDLDRYVIRVSRSSDIGKMWKTTAVSDQAMQGSPSNIAVAVNRDGIIAVTWYDRREDPRHHCWRLYGGLSTDGGEHFGPNVPMSAAPTCTNTPGNWIPEAWGQFDSWTDSLRPRPGFGLTAFVPVRFPNGGETQGLVADRDGVFHSAWVNGQTGVLQLWHTSFAVDPELVARTRRENAAHVAPVGAAVPDGKEDLSLELRFEMSQPAIDFARGVLTVTMQVVNATADPVAGPIDVEAAHLLNPRAHGMGLHHLAAANADNGQSGEGARWTFHGGQGDLIAAHGKSERRVLRFTFDGGIPTVPDGYFEPTFNIYAHRITATPPKRSSAAP